MSTQVWRGLASQPQELCPQQPLGIYEAMGSAESRILGHLRIAQTWCPNGRGLCVAHTWPRTLAQSFSRPHFLGLFQGKNMLYPTAASVPTG